MPVSADNVFRLCSQVVLEGFDEGALVLRLEDCRLFELNLAAHYILAQTDGQRNVARVADTLARAFHIPYAEALRDALSLYTQLSAQKVVGRIEPHQTDMEDRSMEETPTSPRYIRNPDVVLREEDPDEGGLLFNPDTNQVKVINPTGLFIWQQCDGTRGLSEIVAAVRGAFKEVPADQVAQDVQEFVEGMIATSFIGSVETLDGKGPE